MKKWAPIFCGPWAWLSDRCRESSLFLKGLNCWETPNRRANDCLFNFNPPNAVSSSDAIATAVGTSESVVFFNETFDLKRPEMLEGKITIRLDGGKNEENWELIVGCNLPGKWVLHWGVNHVGGVGSEWDQPHSNMRPPGPIPIKDYAIETPFQRLSSSLEGEVFYEVKIDIDTSSSIAAINFVLKDEENRKWYHHRGRDFKVPLIDYPCDAGYVVKVRKGLDKWSGTFGKISNILIKPETIDSKGDDSWKSNFTVQRKQKCCVHRH